LPFTFSKGVHPTDAKGASGDVGITEFPAPAVAYVPLAQHIGAPAEPVVAAGETVRMGQLIAKAVGYVSANIFSPVSGIVKGTESRGQSEGKKGPHLVIENDGRDEEFLLPPLAENAGAEEIVKRIEEAGIVGMGGAGFPAAVKLKSKKPVDTLIINGAECEPYITADYRIMLELTAELAEGCKVLARALGVPKFIIGIENNKPDAIARLSEYFSENDVPGEIAVLRSKYPQGAEKQMIYAVTRRKVPRGGLPADIGVIVHNVHTALSTYNAAAKGQTLYKRVVTVTGGGVEKKLNAWIRTGTPYSDVATECGMSEDTIKILNGGPMMGAAVSNTGVVVTKTTSCLLFLTAAEAPVCEGYTCILCGRCARVCPMKLMPMFIDSNTLVKNFTEAKRYGAGECIRCGCCAYVCPSKRPLVQNILLARKEIAERKL